MSSDELPRVRQKVKLTCKGCGGRHVYDVGTIHIYPGNKSESDIQYAFSNYFRCRECGGGGPWTVDDSWKLLSWTLFTAVGGAEPRVIRAQPRLFDGTTLQTPALGEDYLRGLIAKDPNNAFLHTRLGNLMRGCGERESANKWYSEALTLDPGDIEARFHLFNFAVAEDDVAGAITHVLPMVRHLLDGRRTDRDELTRGIAVWVSETLRLAPPEFRAHFKDEPRIGPESPERTFVRTLLEQEGPEEKIIAEAADRLLEGVAEPSSPDSEEDDPELEIVESEPPIVLWPSLQTLVEAHGLNKRKLSVGLEANDRGEARVKERHLVRISDGARFADWPVPSLRELFRGSQAPPSDIEEYPEQYDGCFYYIERHLLTACQTLGDRTDQEMESIYSALRRRPDGKRMGVTHDFLWQVLALVLGTRVLSQAEYETIVGRLERSVRHWALRPVSRNYVGFLRQHLL